MNYFRARKALELFEEYRHQALLYWLLFTAPDQDSLGQEIAALANEVNAMSAEELAATRRLSEAAQSAGSDAPAVCRRTGGVDEVHDSFTSCGRRWSGGNRCPGESDRSRCITNIPPARTLDIIDNCIGTADRAKSDGLKRLVIPIYWLVDVPALLVRWPWLILEKAGLPPDIERNTWSYVLKALWFVVQVAALLFLVARQVRPDLIRAVFAK